MTEHESGVPAEATAPESGTSAEATAPGQEAMATRGLRYAVDICFCIDVTGSMSPILDRVKDNALSFYDDVQKNLTDKGKNVDELRVRVIAFRDFKADGAAPRQEPPFYPRPAEHPGLAGGVKTAAPCGPPAPSALKSRNAITRTRSSSTF